MFYISLFCLYYCFIFLSFVLVSCFIIYFLFLRFGDGEMSAAQEAAQIKNAIFPQPKLTLKTSVLPLNTEEISLRPASFGE